MTERLERFAAADSSGSVKLAQAFFRFGVDGEIGISGDLVFVDQLGNPYELDVAVGRRTAGNNFSDLPQPQPLVVHPLPNRFMANRRSHRVKSFRKSSRRKVGEHNRLVIRVAGGSRLEQRFQIQFDIGAGRNLFFRPAPGRLTRPIAGSFASSSNSARPRSMVLREQSSTSATYFTPPYPSCLASSNSRRGKKPAKTGGVAEGFS